MSFGLSRSVRFQDDIEVANLATSKVINYTKLDGTETPEPSHHKVDEPQKMSQTLKPKVLSRVYSEDYDRAKKKILDPRGPIRQRWNKIFLIACIISLFADPLFFFLPTTQEDSCLDIARSLKVTLTIIRSIADLFYWMKIIIRFRTAFVAPSSRVFGRGELVVDPSQIARRYLAKGFWIDLIAALPLPQVIIWTLIPNLGGSSMNSTKNIFRFTTIFQYFPRLYQIFPLTAQIVKAAGVVTETAWAGAAYNMMFFMLASHVVGACWYLQSIERLETCWRKVCDLEGPSCRYSFFDCRKKDAARNIWFESSNITDLCSTSGGFFDFGIYAAALDFSITSVTFYKKYFYTLWWGLRNLSCLGQELATTTNLVEIGFSTFIGILGLVLFGFLVGNVQNYLQSTSGRLEECRIKRVDTEQWMRHRQLPQYLKQSVRRYDHFRWVATRGVDEQTILNDLPTDLRREVKRHLCLDLVRQVPLFDEMDERTLDAICDRLKPALCPRGTCLVREGDPLIEMTFIIRGRLDSYTTNGGRTGFFNTSRLGPGDFCGEELLTWALDTPGVILPSSTRTVKALSEVEAFALSAEDLKFVALQFRRLKHLRHKLRFYSQQWRTWAACAIQSAWRRYKRREEAKLKAKESAKKAVNERTPGFSVQAARLAAIQSAGRRFKRRLELAELKAKETEAEEGGIRKLKKPDDDEF